MSGYAIGSYTIDIIFFEGFCLSSELK